MGFLDHNGVSHLWSKFLKNQLGAQIDITTTDTYALSENDDYGYDADMNISTSSFKQCKIPESDDVAITIKNTITSETFDFGTVRLVKGVLYGTNYCELRLNTDTTFEQVAEHGSSLSRINPAAPCGLILFDEDTQATMFCLDIEDISSFIISIAYTKSGVIGLPNNIIGEEFENQNGILLSSFGKTKTKQIYLDTICSRALTAPDTTTPFPLWNASDKIEANIQHGTPYTLSYSKDGRTVEMGKGILVTDESLDAAFGLGEQSIGYWGMVNTDTTIREAAAGGAWLATDENMPTIAIIIIKNISSNASYATFAAPELYNEDERFSGCELVLTLTTEEQETKTITIPNTAIRTDNVPTEGSENYVNSGAIYSYISSIIGDVNSAISQIDAMIGGA